VQITGPLNDLVIEVPLTFDPKPIKFDQHLDFGDTIAGLNLDASGNFELSIDPKFQITLGVRLAPDLPLEQRLFIVKNDAPELTLDVAANIDDPVIQGTIGFLNVKLAEQTLAGGGPDPNNHGITLGGQFTVNLADSDSDDQIHLDELGLG